jgi:hypothetical protein
MLFATLARIEVLMEEYSSHNFQEIASQDLSKLQLLSQGLLYEGHQLSPGI